MKSIKAQQPPANSKKSWRRYSLDLLLLLMVVSGVHYWQTKDNLETGHSEPVPTFKLPSLSGKMISNLNESKIAIYYFFAPWCTICHLSIENLNTLKSDIEAGKVNVYIIALDWKSKSEVLDFVEQHDLPAEVLLGSLKQQQDFKIKGFPTYYIANANNHLEWVSVGYSTSIGFKTRIKLLTD